MRAPRLRRGTVWKIGQCPGALLLALFSYLDLRLELLREQRLCACGHDAAAGGKRACKPSLSYRFFQGDFTAREVAFGDLHVNPRLARLPHHSRLRYDHTPA